MSANLLSRRALLAAAAAVPALKTAKAAGPLEHVDLLIDWKPAPTYAGFYIARESGAFERRGLDVRIAEGRGASISTEVIGAGREHWIGSASGAATAIGRSKGQPVKSLAVYYHDTPTVLYSHTEKPIAAPQDLYGKKIGLVSGSITVEEYRGFLAANKLKRSKITELAVGQDATPLLSGEVDGLIDYAEITPTELTAQGHRITTLRRFRRSHLQPQSYRERGGLGLAGPLENRAQDRRRRARGLSVRARSSRGSGKNLLPPVPRPADPLPGRGHADRGPRARA